jgi:hypothetical protein
MESMALGWFPARGKFSERRYNTNVPVKNLVAGLLTAILLIAPSLATACDLSCAFQQGSSDCEGAKPGPSGPQETKPMAAEPGMTYDGTGQMVMTEPEPPGAFTDSATLSSCTHDPCSRPTASAALVGGKNLAKFTGARWVAVRTVHAPELCVEVFGFKGESPQTCVVMASPPLFSLRI